jgi:hypothetical protein
MFQARLGHRAPLCLTMLLVGLAGPGACVAQAHAQPLALAGAPCPHSALRPVNEYGSLRMQSSKGTTIAEKGVCWGTFNCSVVMRMTLSGTLVTASFAAYLKGGSISGAASARIRYATTQLAYFSGTLTLHGGTGSRSRSSGVARFQGTINRNSYALTIRVTGRLRL